MRATVSGDFEEAEAEYLRTTFICNVMSDKGHLPRKEMSPTVHKLVKKAVYVALISTYTMPFYSVL